jgi:hypothetical protein
MEKGEWHGNLGTRSPREKSAIEKFSPDFDFK